MSPAPPRPSRGPSVTLPLRYLVAAAMAFVAAAAAVVWAADALAGHYYQPRILAVAHVVALGWITVAILGASYQLVPVVLQRPLWSERLARWQFVALVAGIVGLVSHFALGQWTGLAWAAGLVGAGLGAHLVNVALSIRGLSEWTFTARLVAGAHVGLALTVAFGLVLAARRAAGATGGDTLAIVHAHVHLALLGWVAPMVIGVAARVYPMFLLAPEPGGRLGHLQLAGLGLGVPAVVGGLLAAPALVVPGALLVAAALAAHVAWVIDMARRRRRPALDWGLAFVLTGTACLPVATILGLALAAGWLEGPRPAIAYAVVGLGGWVSLTIAGMLLKIVPFLTWQRTYAPRAGHGPVPTLAELSWPTVEGFAYAASTAGVAALAVAVAAGAAPAIRAAGGVLALGAVAFGLALVHVLSHLAPGANRPGPAAAGAAPIGGRLP